MSIPLTIVNTSGLTLNQQGSVTLQNVGHTAHPSTYASPAHVQFYNESGVGFTITFQQSANSFFLPAGAWNTLPIVPGESGINWTVSYVLQNQPVTQLVIIYFYPGEQVPDVGTIGNSPLAISGAVQTTGIQSLQNDGNPVGTQIVEATPAGDVTSAVSLNNEGTLVLGNSTHTGSISSDNGKFKTDGAGNVSVGAALDIETNLYFRDNTNTKRFFAAINGANNDNTLAANSINNLLHLSGNALNDVMTLNGTSGLMRLFGTLQLGGTSNIVTVSGTTAGTVQLVLLSSLPLILFMYFLNYNNTTAVRQQFNIPSLFPNAGFTNSSACNNGAFAWVGGITDPNTSGCYFRRADTTLAHTNSIGSFSKGNGGTLFVQIGSTSRVPCGSIAEVTEQFQLVEVDGSLVGTSLGTIAIIGF